MDPRETVVVTLKRRTHEAQLAYHEGYRAAMEYVRRRISDREDWSTRPEPKEWR